MNRLNEIAERCSAPFARDAELKTEIENEVNDHLASAAAEVGEEEAVKRFGDPEPVAQELLLSNFNRLKWRSRFKLAVKILIVPAVLASVFFCVSRDAFGGNLLLIDIFDSNRDAFGNNPLLQDIFRKDSMSHDPDARMRRLNSFMLLAGRPRLNSEEYRMLSGIPAPLAELKVELENTPNPVNRARYIMALIADKNAAPDAVEDELAAAVAAEPDNALYDLLLSERLCRRAVEQTGYGKDTVYTVKDRKLLDRAMACYLSGIEKPHLRTYLAEIYATNMAMFPNDGTFTGWSLKLMAASNWLLPHICPMRRSGEIASYYTELLVAENDPRADEFLNGWKRQSLLMLESDDPTRTMEWSANSVTDRSPVLVDALRKHGHEKAAAELARQADEAGTIRRADLLQYCAQSSPKIAIENYAGRCRELSLSDLMATPESQSSCQRLAQLAVRVVALEAIDSVALAAMELLAAVMMLVLAFDFWADHRGAYMMVLPGRSYLKLLLFGVVIPLVLWQVWSHICSETPMPVMKAGMRSAMFLPLYLVWFTVLAVLVLRRRYRRLNAAKITRPLQNGNLVVLLAGFVLVNSLIMRPYFSWVEHRAMSGTMSMFSGKHWTAAEGNINEAIRGGRIKILKEIIKQPIRLEQTGK